MNSVRAFLDSVLRDRREPVALSAIAHIKCPTNAPFDKPAMVLSPAP